MVKGRNTTVIGIRISDSDWNILKEEADKQNCSVSNLVKRYVEAETALLRSRNP